MSESDRHHQSTAYGWFWAWLTVAAALATTVSAVQMGLREEWQGASIAFILIGTFAFEIKRMFSLLMHADEIQARADEVRASDTGTWRLFVHGEAPERFTVRWDAWGRQYISEARTEDGFNATWVDSLTLAGIIEGQERAGWVPNDDEATRAIRARLDLAPLKREDTL